MATKSFLLQRFDSKLCEQYLNEAMLQLRRRVDEAEFQETQQLACLQLLVRDPSISDKKTKSRAVAVLDNQNQKVIQSYIASLCKFVLDNMLRIRYKEPRSEIMSSIETLIFCSKRIRSVAALSSVRRQFQRHFGRRFVSKAVENANGSVNNSIALRLSENYITPESVNVLILALGNSSTISTTDDQRPAHSQSSGESRQQTIDGDAYSKIQAIQSYKTSVAAVTGLEEEKETSEDWENLPTAFGASPISISPSVQIIVEKREARKSGVASFSPTLPIYVFQPNSSLEIGFDARSRNPLYVLERLSGNTQHESSRAKKQKKFYEENRLPEEYRSKFHHYFRSGYDRGHMAPAADFAGENYADTFTLSNISPQVHSMNCSIWAKLENWCRHAAKIEFQNYGGRTYVVTGPLWIPNRTGSKTFEYSFPAIGLSAKSVVQVPTHFFKIIAVVSDDRICKFGCFVVPNEEVDGTETRSLQQYVANWTDVEAMSGMIFFPNLTSDDGWKERADSLARQMGQGEWAHIPSPKNSSPFKRKNKIMSTESTFEHLVV